MVNGQRPRKVYELSELAKEVPELFGVPTGTKLDELFFTMQRDTTTGKFVKKPLGGIPYRSVLNVVGQPDTGKSLFAEQFACYQAARGYRVLFVTSESPAEFLYAGLQQRAMALGIEFARVEENVFVIDASIDTQLREDIRTLLNTLEYAIRTKRTSIAIVDSITGFYEHKEMAARQIVRAVFNLLKRYKQTALLISQKRSSQGVETAEAAGGLAVAHIVDGTIVMDKKLIETKWEMNLYGLELGSLLRTLRIDGCRLCGHDTSTWVMEITESGLIEIKMRLSDLIRRFSR